MTWQEKLIQLDIDNIDRAIGLINELKEVVKKFDGKVYNVRFDRAVKETVGALVERKSTMYENSIAISWKPDIRNIFIDGHYSRNQEYYLLWGAKLDGKRINATKTIEVLENRAKELEEEKTNLYEGISKIEEILDKYNGIKKQLEELRDEVPYDIRGYFNIETPFLR